MKPLGLAVALAFACVVGCDDGRSAPVAPPGEAGSASAWPGDEDLHVVLCGTGSALPDRGRAGACTAILAAGRLLLVDTGPGSWEQVELLGLPRERLAGVLLTRLDPGSIGDLGEALIGSWETGREGPLPVYGPPGVVGVADGFQKAYAPAASARLKRHGADGMHPAGAEIEAHPLVALRDPEPVLEEEGLRVLAFPVPAARDEAAVGYRVERGGRSVVVLGGVRSSEALRAAVAGADVVIHEVQAAHMVHARAEELEAAGEARRAARLRARLGRRATPADALALAREAGARLLVLTRLFPPEADRRVVRAFLRGPSEGWEGRVLFGEDGQHLVLPVSGEPVRVERVASGHEEGGP